MSDRNPHFDSEIFDASKLVAGLLTDEFEALPEDFIWLPDDPDDETRFHSGSMRLSGLEEPMNGSVVDIAEIICLVGDKNNKPVPGQRLLV